MKKISKTSHISRNPLWLISASLAVTRLAPEVLLRQLMKAAWYAAVVLATSRYRMSKKTGHIRKAQVREEKLAMAAVF